MKRYIYSLYYSILICLILVIMPYDKALSQFYNESTPFQFVYQGIDDFDNLAEINFIDPITKVVHNSISLAELNPFRNLKYQKIEKGTNDSFRNYERYLLNNIYLKDINLQEGKIISNNKLTDTLFIRNAIIDVYHSWDIVDSTLIIKFELAIIDYDNVLAYSDVFFIFDQFGNLIKEINSLDYRCNEFTITSNRKFFASTYSITNDSFSESIDGFGYFIYSLSENRIAYQENFNPNFIGIGLGNYGNILRIGLIKDNYTEDLIYLNLESGYKYEKNLPDATLYSIKETFDFGIVTFYNGISDTIYFEKEFRKEEIE